jgi:uncharacterized protein (TIGR02172 family)
MAASKVKDLPSKPIAEGRTAEVYLWDDGHILKLYRDWCPSHWVDYETRVAGAVYAAGVPSPAAGPIVEVNGRRGLVYERLEGISMLQELNAHPWRISKLARSLAELQVQINQQSITGLPAYKDRLQQDIHNTAHLSENLRKKALTMLTALPDGKNLCHGDFHPGNVLMTKRGPVVIDWMTACAGVPGADVARTLLLCSIGAKAAGKQIRSVARMAIRFYARAYQNRYTALSPETPKQAELWMPVIAAARLNENIMPEREALIEIVKKASVVK